MSRPKIYLVPQIHLGETLRLNTGEDQVPMTMWNPLIKFHKSIGRLLQIPDITLNPPLVTMIVMEIMVEIAGNLHTLPHWVYLEDVVPPVG